MNFLWTDIDSKLEVIFMMIPEKAFSGFSVMTVADLLQLPPVRGKLSFSQFSDNSSIKDLLGLQLRHSFKYAELIEVVRQNNKVFINLVNQIQVGNIDDDAENLLKVRFIHQSDENYAKDALHMYAENEPAIKRNEAVLNELPDELYTIEARYPLVLILRLLRIKGRRFGKVAPVKNWWKSNVKS